MTKIVKYDISHGHEISSMVNSILIKEKIEMLKIEIPEIHFS